VLLLAACGGGTKATKVVQTTSSEQAVEQFMKAVADSNLAKMATYWGTAKGPAAETRQPPDYERRIVVIQAYLRGASYRLLGGDPVTPGGDRRTMQVEIRRENCVTVVPFQTVKTPSGSWVVSSIDLAAVGTPGRGCGAGASGN
jgi:hypothetical protein